MKVSIHQPNYLPWMGLIRKILNSDIFIIFDDVQLVRGKSYVIRTKIKTSGGPKWISVPVENKNDLLKINQIKINHKVSWQDEHWNKIFENYHKTKYFDKYSKNFKKIFFQKQDSLVELNFAFIKEILDVLNIQKNIKFSSELGVEGTGTDKIINLIKAVNGDEYISGTGKGSSRYIIDNEIRFEDNNIKLIFQKFNHPIYNQTSSDFVPNLSIIDAIFNIGPEDTLKIMNKKL
ncbi:MAG: WbqC family protein [Nitrosopumilus sp.]|nr:WbqC family protein [Nitrosopumilus sp.]